MLFRFISKPSNVRLLSLISSQPHFSNPRPYSFSSPNPPTAVHSFNLFSNNTSRYFSSNRNDNNNGKDQSASEFWKFYSEKDCATVDSVFGEDTGSLEGMHGGDAEEMKPDNESKSWLTEEAAAGDDGEDIFKGADADGKGIDVGSEVGDGGGGGGDEWVTAEGYKPWNFVAEEEENEVFDIRDREVPEMHGLGGEDRVPGGEKSEEEKRLEMEEKTLTAVLKGPNRAFGDAIAASGITEEMLDSLMLIKDMGDIQGLPSLAEIEDLRYEKSMRKSPRAEIESQKQEDVAKSRVRQLDAKGRAYGTGKRKCSIARVWIKPGDGKFVVNDKEFDVYFPILDHRAALLRPFSETKTLGLWDIDCTVKGGGVSGQVGAIQLGISRALQNWEPDLRPPLRSGGFLTRDSRVVERKKPGKAKARKSFQWVKR